MRKMTDYPNTHPETDSHQFGTFKNESEPNKSDGTDIKAEHMQDPYYALYQILQLAGELPNGELENGSNSKQFIRSLTNIGWFKYDSSISYKRSSIVINTINNITKLYRSKKDNNTSALTDTNSWVNILTINNDSTITLNTNSTENTGVFIGAFMYGIRADTPEGWLRCNGADYPASVFMGFITNYLLTGKITYKTIAEWNIEYNKNNGNCGYFAYKEEIIERNEEINEPILDEDGNVIIIQAGILRVPCLQDRVFIAQALNSGNISKFTGAGLPNITGQFSVSVYTRYADGVFANNGGII